MARLARRARGTNKHYWSPEKTGSDFEMSQTLEPLKPYRDYLTIVSDTDCIQRPRGLPLKEGADHFRSSCVLSDRGASEDDRRLRLFVGTSIDQLYAQKFGQDTPLPSIQLCIEMVDASGACDYGYA